VSKNQSSKEKALIKAERIYNEVSASKSEITTDFVVLMILFGMSMFLLGWLVAATIPLIPFLTMLVLIVLMIAYIIGYRIYSKRKREQVIRKLAELLLKKSRK
jgi:Flp pilus assembly protein TadB